MLASFSISPVGVGEALSKHVAEIIDIIDRSGLKYKLGAMQTTVEGDDSEVMALILQCHRHMRKKANAWSRISRSTTARALRTASRARSRMSRRRSGGRFRTSSGSYLA